MVFGQALEASGGSETLSHQHPNGDCNLILLGGRPSVNILQKTWQGGLFQRFLKILVSKPTGISFTTNVFFRGLVPSDQLILHIDVFLELFGRSGVLRVHNGPRTNR